MDRFPSLHAVRCFSVAARLRSFTAAAKELHVTQGAISRMVQSLEDDLGVQLFERNGRYISLTTVGENYHQEVHRALLQIADASSRARQSQADDALSVVVSAGFATRWLVPRLSEFERLHPKVRVNILAADASEATQEQANQVMIRYGTGPWPGCMATRLALGSVLGVVCAPHTQARCALREPKDLVNQRLLTYSGASRDPWQDFFVHFQLAIPDLQQAPRFSQLLMLAEAAVSGMGIALVPLFLFKAELQSGRLVQAIPQTLRSDRGYFITHPQGAERDRKVQVFKKWLLSKARQSSDTHAEAGIASASSQDL